MTKIFMLIAALIVGIILLFIRHQQRLKRSAYLMQEALRNHDFQFRLSTRGLLAGERAMQEALNNVGQELRRQIAAHEVESWKKLTRVLTHEIMNATTPIASISQTFLNRPDVKGTPLEEGILAIHDTSVALNSFVQNYRKMTLLQTPHIQQLDLSALIDGVKLMFKELQWTTDINDSSTLKADEGLLRQVVINLVKNALEAHAKRINVSHYGNEIRISNDGEPIPPEVQREMFTPFFTTKSTGSGIGLSLSRQIMVSQNGDLFLADSPLPSYHATFVLAFCPSADSSRVGKKSF